MAQARSALDVIAEDHRTIEDLFARYEQARDTEQRTEIAHEVVHELAVHGEVEELLFYPRVRDAAPEGGRLAEEAEHEHVEIKETLNAIDSMNAEDEGFDEQVRALMGEVRHHVEEEESAIFPLVRDAMSEDDLTDLGGRLERAKSVVPTRPHPKAPTSPAGKAVAAPGAALIDRVRDALRKAGD